MTNLLKELLTKGKTVACLCGATVTIEKTGQLPADWLVYGYATTGEAHLFPVCPACDARNTVKL
jgi:hypothetical protein